MDLEHAVGLIRESHARVFVVASGGGAGLQEKLWRFPGSSAFLVGAAFPYAGAAIDELLGFRPAQYCCRETALELALEAFLRAGAEPNAIGVGLTATVASASAHRGEHRIHVAYLSARGAKAGSVLLDKAAGTDQRQRDGEIADNVGLDALLDAIGEPPLSNNGCVFSDCLTEARARFFAHAYFRADGTREAAPRQLRACFPGTFDPPHAGHLGMAAQFTEATGIDPAFWISAAPPHKDVVSLAELLRRARALRGREVLFTEGDPLYLDKARRYPGCEFVIGADAMQRLLDPKWGVAVEPLLREFRALNVRFRVASRLVEGRLLALADIADAPLDLCVPLAGQWDVSSTQLRNAARS